MRALELFLSSIRSPHTKQAIKLYQSTKQKAEKKRYSCSNGIEMMGHDLSKWTILPLMLTPAILIVGLIILVTK
jgi:hypothetical protein